MTLVRSSFVSWIYPSWYLPFCSATSSDVRRGYSFVVLSERVVCYMGALAFVAVKHGLAMFIRSYVTCAACLQVSPVSVSLGGLPILTCSWKLGCSCAGVAGHKLGACALPSAWTGVRHFSYFGVCGNAGVMWGCRLAYGAVGLPTVMN
jgi:hypothetical protein